jgi:hypothetical protein
MKINFNQQIVKLDGKTFCDQDKEPITLAKICSECLLSVYEGEKKPQGDIQAQRYDLAVRVYKGGELEFSLRELSVMQDRVEKHPMIAIAVQAKRMLEPKE